MKKRKLIGVIISEVEGLYQNKLLRGIISECYSLDYDVAVFSTLIKNSGLPEYKNGEKNIFHLMNFELFDGIIVAGRTLSLEHLPLEIEHLLLKSCRCPVLYIDENSQYFPSICTNDSRPMEQLTDHLIETHGYRDIYCLAGGKENVATINRLEGVRASFRKHNMTFDESRISYEGEFFYPGGELLARRLLEGEIAWPQAVICISDYMAIGLVNELLRNGIRVPEDIAVTGYDATEEAATCHDMITTYDPPVMQTGVRAVCELTRLMTGVLPEMHNSFEDYLEIGRSCGCNDIDHMMRDSIVRLKEKSDDYQVLLDSYMTEVLTAALSFEECINQFCYYLYLIKDYSDYYLCLCDNWDGSADNYSLEKDEVQTTGYTDWMTLVLSVENRAFVGSDYNFDIKDMLPDLWKDRKKPKAYYFTPVHFNQHCMGYSVLTYGDKAKSFDIIYRNWSRNIMNALEFNRTHRKLYRSSFRDVLTGIYNRSGIEQNAQQTIDEANRQSRKIFVLMADLDNLKIVNDYYGHLEGDNVITVVANALQSNCKPRDICARIGGDEFLVVGVDGAGEDSVEYYVNLVKQNITFYNEISNKPYEIEISIGSISEYAKDSKKISYMIDQADQLMYYQKAMNKKRRLKKTT